MKILACDTSSSVCAVGVFENDKLINKNELDNGKTHSENFMPLVEKTLRDADLSLVDIDYVATVVGPGSFTGIRIGVASCKAMAEVASKKMISLYSLEVLAANEYKKGKNICALIDARNNQVYCGIFDENLDKKEEFMADDIGVCLENLSKYDDIVFVGDGSVIHQEQIEKLFKNKNIEFSKNNKQNADGLGIASNKKVENVEFVSADEIIPVYLRKSQAERMKMNIIEMKKEHLDSLIADLKDYDEFWNEKILIDEFENSNSEYFVLTDKDNILGFAGLWFNIDEAHIMNIAVKKKYRKNGFGTKLLQFLIDEAEKKNKECITLEVREDNVAAISLYQKLKFEKIGRRKKYYNSEIDAIIMTKTF